MANFDDDSDGLDEESTVKTKIDKKKILIFLLPALIVIGSVVSFYSVFNKKFQTPENLPYNVIQQPDAAADGTNKILIFYDLPEITTQIKDENEDRQTVKIKINIELTSMEDIKKVEDLMPKINDAIISHTKELNSDEISGSTGLYWLKEELLYRINLIVSPVKISNINFKNFEIQKNS